ncbi:MAG TPA: hypothetical protein VKA15_23265 [Isosphaeraceae bacterium]|nr:hypothetical protein [Isosphaeraceae bacterium]
MSIGLGMSRSSRQGVRIGGSRPTVREVCLLGMTRRARNEPWTTGQRIIWLGRGYQVVATSMSTLRAATQSRPADDDSPIATSALDYVHLGPCDGA